LSPPPKEVTAKVALTVANRTLVVAAWASAARAATYGRRSVAFPTGNADTYCTSSSTVAWGGRVGGAGVVVTVVVVDAAGVVVVAAADDVSVVVATAVVGGALVIDAVVVVSEANVVVVVVASMVVVVGVGAGGGKDVEFWAAAGPANRRHTKIATCNAPITRPGEY
jgi:hypothetical protein